MFLLMRRGECEQQNSRVINVSHKQIRPAFVTGYVSQRDGIGDVRNKCRELIMLNSPQTTESTHGGANFAERVGSRWTWTVSVYPGTMYVRVEFILLDCQREMVVAVVQAVSSVNSLVSVKAASGVLLRISYLSTSILHASQLLVLHLHDASRGWHCRLHRAGSSVARSPMNQDCVFGQLLVCHIRRVTIKLVPTFPA